ncbi:hypothetical protein FGG79_20790 [Bacillus sp. BHET2]|uniref:hypothetical protein n=1 Tax=Bacillus sp. BHET2 TaxID=2583818 RepID=UPI00110E7718|nr:hypothetical protein [Bacillus sp. BHET2]TMU82721.1 hypothetical protein FGG79_20790 [Bacillus sp. BHET2]
MNNPEGSLPLKRTNLFLVVILSVVTAGIYLAFWFLRRRKAFGESQIPFKWWKVFAVYLILSFIINLIGDVFLTSYGETVIESINIILSYYFIGLLYFSAFRVKEVIEYHYRDAEVKKLWLVLFHVWYLQFKINRLKEN